MQRSPDFGAELDDRNATGTLRVGDSHVTYDVDVSPSDADCLRTCVTTAARLGERVERVSGERRESS